jgi:hypothetical protein
VRVGVVVRVGVGGSGVKVLVGGLNVAGWWVAEEVAKSVLLGGIVGVGAGGLWEAGIQPLCRASQARRRTINPKDLRIG